MWISRTYDKFHPGFPVKPSLPGFGFSSKFTKILCGFPVPFIKQKHVLHRGVWIFFALAQWRACRKCTPLTSCDIQLLSYVTFLQEVSRHHKIECISLLLNRSNYRLSNEVKSEIDYSILNQIHPHGNTNDHNLP